MIRVARSKWASLHPASEASYFFYDSFVDILSNIETHCCTQRAKRATCWRFFVDKFFYIETHYYKVGPIILQKTLAFFSHVWGFKVGIKVTYLMEVVLLPSNMDFYVWPKINRATLVLFRATHNIFTIVANFSVSVKKKITHTIKSPKNFIRSHHHLSNLFEVELKSISRRNTLFP